MDKEISWLCNPFGDDRIYTTLFRLDNKHFSWKFYLIEETQDQALISAIFFLNYLKEIFPGLVGNVLTRGISNTDLYRKLDFRELVLPEPPFLPNTKLNLIDKVCNLFYINKNHVITVYIAWQKDDSISHYISHNSEYKVKIFLNTQTLPSLNTIKNKQTIELEGRLQYLTSGLQNARGDKAFLRSAPSETWEDILKGTTFFRNSLEVYTGRYYRILKDNESIPEYMIPGFVKPEEVDFGIPKTIPLIKAVGLQHENVGFDSHSNEGDIELGYYIRDGEITKRKKYLSLNDLTKHLYINGLTGAGKTRFLAYLVNEIAKMFPDVGLLIILLDNEIEKTFFTYDIIEKYPNTNIPYTFLFEDLDPQIQNEDLSYLLTSSVGLKNIYTINMENVLNVYFNKQNTYPTFLGSVYKRFWKWFKDKKYPGDFGGTSLLAIENRVFKLLTPELENVVKFTSEIPYWFKEFLNGKNILLDLTSCKENEQTLLVNLIFQMIKIFVPQNTDDKLKYLIIIDEIDKIVKISKTFDSGDDLFVKKEFLGKVITRYMETFRKRGLGVINTGHEPTSMFESIYYSPNKKILFTTSPKSTKLFINDFEDQETLSYLGVRRALVIDSIMREKYLIYTRDFNGEILKS